MTRKTFYTMTTDFKVKESIEIENRGLNKLRPLYTYLNEVDFEQRVKKHVMLLRKLKNSKTFDIIGSDLNTTQFIFSIIRDLYEKIYDDLKKEFKDDKNV